LDKEDGVGAYLATDKAKEKLKEGINKIIFKFSPLIATEESPDGQVFL
jgi:hypothetical protein